MSELSDKNFRRISIINWLLSVPMLVLFAWPYYYICQLLLVQETIQMVGSLLFAMPFMMTILHGHVTMALGSVHRQNYYQWLYEHPYTFGLFFSRIEISTRFRLVMLLISLMLLAAGFVLAL
jgi:hypothetical protein